MSTGTPRTTLARDVGDSVPETRHNPPRYCRTPEVSSHDTREPCELCTLEREPGAEG